MTLTYETGHQGFGCMYSVLEGERPNGVFIIYMYIFCNYGLMLNINRAATISQKKSFFKQLLKGKDFPAFLRHVWWLSDRDANVTQFL